VSPRTLWILSLAAATGYFVTIPWHPFPGSIALKGLSVSALALLALQSELEGRNRILLTAALALSSLGDVLLDLSPSQFVPGLAAFLLAHLCYIQLFFAQRRKGDRLGAIRGAAVAGLFLFSIAFTIWLVPVLGDLGFPVVMYVGVLTGMVFTAISWRAQRSDFIVFGAFLFLISDAVLGAAKFRGPVPLRGWIVWGTYYAAQSLIASGVLRELRR
jgi:uncharacterized membrane protein YhhN